MIELLSIFLCVVALGAFIGLPRRVRAREAAFLREMRLELEAMRSEFSVSLFRTIAEAKRGPDTVCARVLLFARAKGAGEPYLDGMDVVVRRGERHTVQLFPQRELEAGAFLFVMGPAGVRLLETYVGQRACGSGLGGSGLPIALLEHAAILGVTISAHVEWRDDQS